MLVAALETINLLSKLCAMPSSCTYVLGSTKFQFVLGLQ
jgi:hypothetical protein